ncbi:MAG: hypothetical protein ACOCQR_03890 [bacterium]
MDKEQAFDETINQIRQNIKSNAKLVMDVKNDKANSETDGKEDVGEVMANLMLCYRHLEDASMRLGKVHQAKNGGVSIYDHNVVGDPEENNEQEDK